MVPRHARPAHYRLRAKLAEMRKFNEEQGPNLEIEGKGDLGIIASGVAFQHAREAVESDDFVLSAHEDAFAEFGANI